MDVFSRKNTQVTEAGRSGNESHWVAVRTALQSRCEGEESARRAHARARYRQCRHDDAKEDKAGRRRLAEQQLVPRDFLSGGPPPAPSYRGAS
ncbi:hypothetical protein AAFF_G00173150 [Aldrovandia affinis]|uniref:Uncharacterized protein n=1 Tax=Aldrovandia affinis TaxID=143900 RepID=A0AAD7SYU8_9TELE|nr:hypothetical protein AAFF_G00173150 [Aldrovandia affinis]